MWHRRGSKQKRKDIMEEMQRHQEESELQDKSTLEFIHLPAWMASVKVVRSLCRILLQVRRPGRFEGIFFENIKRSQLFFISCSKDEAGTRGHRGTWRSTSPLHLLPRVRSPPATYTPINYALTWLEESREAQPPHQASPPDPHSPSLTLLRAPGVSACHLPTQLLYFTQKTTNFAGALNSELLERFSNPTA